MTELTLAADSRLVQCPNLMVSPMGNGLALMGAGGGEDNYFELNGSGRLNWELLQVPRTPAELVAALAESYDIDESLCLADTRGSVETSSQPNKAYTKRSMPM